MTSTNRFLNRLLVFVVGAVLLVAGAAVAVGAVLPDVRTTVDRGAKAASKPTAEALSGGQPWILWVTAAAAAVLIVLLLVFIFRQGHGRTSTLLVVSDSKAKGSLRGTLTIDAKVAEHVLEEALARTPSIVSVDVTAFEVKRQNVLRITAQTLRGTSPVQVRDAIDRAVSDWDAVLGTETPVAIQIIGGLRSRMSGTSRVQ